MKLKKWNSTTVSTKISKNTGRSNGRAGRVKWQGDRHYQRNWFHSEEKRSSFIVSIQGKLQVSLVLDEETGMPVVVSDPTDEISCHRDWQTLDHLDHTKLVQDIIHVFNDTDYHLHTIVSTNLESCQILFIT
jgi:hypothetical protein